VDELRPGFGAARCGAAAYQFFNRYGGESLHCLHRCAESTFYRVLKCGLVACFRGGSNLQVMERFSEFG
jgi:hypothetical protein